MIVSLAIGVSLALMGRGFRVFAVVLFALFQGVTAAAAQPGAAEPADGSKLNRIENKEPAFSFVIPDGYRRKPTESLIDPGGLEVLYAFSRSADNRIAGYIVKMPAEMEQVVLVPDAFDDEIRKYHPSIFRERWQGLDLYAVRFINEQAGKTVVILMVLVPIRGFGIRLEFHASVIFEPAMITALRSTLSELKGETNWLDTAPGQPNQPKPPKWVPPEEEAQPAPAKPLAVIAPPAPANAEASSATPDEMVVPVWMAGLLGGVGLVLAVLLTVFTLKKRRPPPIVIRRAPLQGPIRGRLPHNFPQGGPVPRAPSLNSVAQTPETIPTAANPQPDKEIRESSG